MEARKTSEIGDYRRLQNLHLYAQKFGFTLGVHLCSDFVNKILLT